MLVEGSTSHCLNHLVFALSNTDALPAYRLLTKRSHEAAEMSNGSPRFALVKQSRDRQGFAFAKRSGNRFAWAD